MQTNDCKLSFLVLLLTAYCLLPTLFFTANFISCELFQIIRKRVQISTAL